MQFHLILADIQSDVEMIFHAIMHHKDIELLRIQNHKDTLWQLNLQQRFSNVVNIFASSATRESMMLRTYWTYTKEKPSYYGQCTIHNSCRRLLHMHRRYRIKLTINSTHHQNLQRVTSSHPSSKLQRKKLKDTSCNLINLDGQRSRLDRKTTTSTNFLQIFLQGSS